MSNSRGDPYLMTGRAIRRLVSLTDRVEDLVGEYDRRTSLYDSDDDPQYTEEEGRTYQSFQQLLRWVPTVRNLISSQTDGHQLNLAYQKLNQGADSARGDDAASMKLAVASWLNESSPPPNPPIHSRDKTGRGFYNDATAKLLCPVDFNWADTVTKEGIRNYEPNFQVTAHSWPSFLYRDGEYDQEDPTKGLFKGSFLVRTFKHIFTSPSSAADARPDEEIPLEPLPKRSRTQGERRTRSDLRFALSSCGSWRNVDDDFEHDQFYIYIVDYFENPPTPTAKASVDALLVWWNRKVFGPRSMSTYSPQVAAHYSVANTSAKRH
ncbi:hypothetical protein P692DRAFT_201703947 [Suillus brevipes Sb2]|nr:hypothetical protein P692DRAFT_201703835 [Suillus brevipes Sb2]KAG2754554.1 hypothetical protein P692DRAFT_201703947 [Suillus brevipes Sb2]